MLTRMCSLKKHHFGGGDVIVAHEHYGKGIICNAKSSAEKLIASRKPFALLPYGMQRNFRLLKRPVQDTVNVTHNCL